ncbi:uncharacterized protein EDB91DRAFT_1102883 [Suillus paluster]|uniref:uncharacterized protein n=1 Tax=Suillus paluster TaxID=48578 RepID=UPI001B885529|nr:uncharacterized protein EDB91DRAFT_1102883 [Suillus paluster]KAG1752488.1 hypothetical protein EDB91DRAFT_1102883 [Suillus paluster]
MSARHVHLFLCIIRVAELISPAGTGYLMARTTLNDAIWCTNSNPQSVLCILLKYMHIPVIVILGRVLCECMRCL